MALSKSVINERFPDFDEQLRKQKEKLDNQEDKVSYKEAAGDGWQKELTNRFSYHESNETQQRAYTELRRMARELAYAVVVMVPEGRERALALTKIEEAVFWANAGIARNE